MPSSVSQSSFLSEYIIASEEIVDPLVLFTQRTPINVCRSLDLP